MATIAELIGANPEQVQDLLDNARIAEEAKRAEALAEEAARGQKALEASKAVASEPAEFAGRKAQALSKQAKAAMGEMGEKVISDLPSVSGKMGAAMERAARAAAGTAGEGVIEAAGPKHSLMSRLSDLAEKFGPSALEKLGISPSSIQALGKSAVPAVKIASKAVLPLGIAAEIALMPSAGEGSDVSGKQLSAKDAQMLAKDLAPGHYVTSSDVEPGDATEKYPSKQLASSAYDSLDQIKSDVKSQPMTPGYRDAYVEMLNQRSKFLDNLESDRVWQGNTSRPLTDEEKEERYAKYEAGLLGEENLAKRASLMVEQKETQQKELEGQLAQIDSQINTSTNPFVVQRLNKEKNNLLATLSNLTSSSSEESSKTPASLTREPSEFLQELMSRPVAQMPQQPAAGQPQSSETESLKPTKRTISAGEPSAIDVQKRDREEGLSKIIGAEAAKQVAEQESLLARFKQAQERQRMAQLSVGLTQAAERIGSSIAMTKPGDQSPYEQAMRLASGISEQVKDEEAIRQEAEKNDPNSPLSKQFQELVKSMGAKLTGNESAATLIKALPFIQQYQSQKENREARIEQAKILRESIAVQKEKEGEQKLDKEFGSLYESLDPTKGRAGQFGEQYKNVVQADRLGGLIDKSGYGMNLTGPEMEELALGTARLLSGTGGSSRAQVEALVPHSIRGKLNDTVSWLINKPMGREQQEFVKRLKGLVDREKALAQDKIETIITQRAKAKSHLKQKDPEKFKEAVNSAIQAYAGKKSSDAASKQGMEPSGEKKETVKLPKKQTGNVGKVIVSKDGKRYRINSDETTATEI